LHRRNRRAERASGAVALEGEGGAGPTAMTNRMKVLRPATMASTCQAGDTPGPRYFFRKSSSSGFMGCSRWDGEER
jgi:hypothetical protein